MDIKHIGVSTSSFGYTMGMTGRQTERENPQPWTLEQFVDFAIAQGFGGVEAPVMRFVPDLNRERLTALRATCVDHGLFFVVDAEAALNSEQIRALIPVAQEFGSPIIRIKSSNILGLMRKKLERPWAEHVAQCIHVLTELAPELRHNGLRIAIENHQDLDSNDLLEIIEGVGDDVVGVNFDIGNAFASCEDPMEFARKLGSSIINIHLKDYKIYKSEEGFRLVRCPVGSGSVDFKTLLPILHEQSPAVKMVIELGAQEARNIAWLQPDFWSEIQPRQSNELIAFFQLLEQETMRTDDDSWKTSWEKGAPCDTIVSTESAELVASSNYIKTI